ncbi:hypothetical protein [Faecalibaculum rodentium]|uniref:hypothetical protein n=1 Tax=Faecalibaculum rodentium TaxID=1702221 RepID=UPI0025B74A70|nr:hypothetical protein [Faecalibaculum rodentium]
MYPLINTKAKGLDVIIECNQYDQGAIRNFRVDHDISGESARFVIDLKDGTKVTDWCKVIDSHTLQFVIPINCTRNEGTYEAQIVFYGKNHVTDSFERWKAAVLAGRERVLVVPGIEDAGTATAQVDPDTAISSFAFKIIVSRSVHQDADVYQQLVEKWGEAIKTMQNEMKSQKNAIETAINKVTGQMDEMEKDYTEKIESVDSAKTQLQEQIQQLDLTNIVQRLSTQESWKAAVLAGSEPVIIKTEEAPAAPAEDTQTDQSEGGIEDAKG